MEVPIVLAPMAGGPSTPELAAAVSRAGGLGTLGVAYLGPGAIGEEIARLRRLTDRPFAVNLFVAAAPPVDADQVAATWATLAPYRAEVGLDDLAVPPRFAEPFEDQVEAVCRARVPIVTFTFGVADAAVLEDVRQSGAVIGVMVTTAAEAEMAAASEIDFLILQGSEAGGHRGTFDPRGGELVPLAALIRQCRDVVDLPVFAAGGLMDGRSIADVLRRGAAAAQLGTAFLGCDEAGTSAPYREALQQSDGTTVITTAISGRAARGLPNRLTAELAGIDVPPYPIMNALTAPIRRRAAELGRSDLLSLWAGVGVGALRAQPAAELFGRLVSEMEAALA